MSTPAFRRIVRRETHSPRTVAMIVAVVLLIAALVYIGIEIVLYLAAQPALLLGPGAAATWLIGLPSAQPGALVATGGVVLAVLGLVFAFLAIAPGRLSKHEMRLDGRAVVVDNGVIASAVAQRISDESGLSRDDITVGVSHRTIDVTVRPGLGVPLEVQPIEAVAAAEVASYQLTPSVKTRVRVIRATESENPS